MKLFTEIKTPGRFFMRKIYVLLTLVLFILLTGCDSTKVDKENNTRKLPESIPSFVNEKDFKKINWNRKAMEFDTGTRSDMVGNKKKLGIIGPYLKPNQVEKWMWHFWDIKEGEMTVVGFNRVTSKIIPILYNGETKIKYWSKDIAGPNNGADSHSPSNVLVSEAGEWAFMVYVNGKLFDTLVMEIRD
jgi:cell division protein FtsL